MNLLTIATIIFMSSVIGGLIHSIVLFLKSDYYKYKKVRWSTKEEKDDIKRVITQSMLSWVMLINSVNLFFVILPMMNKQSGEIKVKNIDKDINHNEYVIREYFKMITNTRSKDLYDSCTAGLKDLLLYVKAIIKEYKLTEEQIIKCKKQIKTINKLIKTDLFSSKQKRLISQYLYDKKCWNERLEMYKNAIENFESLEK